MEKSNPQKAVDALTTALWVLLSINIVVIIIFAVFSFVSKATLNGFVLLGVALLDGILFGTVISLLQHAFDSIIENLDLPKQKRQAIDVSTPAPDVSMEESLRFREEVEEALGNQSEEQQIDWLQQWMGELSYLYEQEQNPEKKQVFQEELDYITVSLAALESGT